MRVGPTCSCSFFSSVLLAATIFSDACSCSLSLITLVSDALSVSVFFSSCCSRCLRTASSLCSRSLWKHRGHQLRGPEPEGRTSSALWGGGGVQTHLCLLSFCSASVSLSSADGLEESRTGSEAAEEPWSFCSLCFSLLKNQNTLQNPNISKSLSHSFLVLPGDLLFEEAVLCLLGLW